MSPRFGVPILVALLLASSWAFTNNDTVEQWVSENTIVVQEQEVPLLQLQEQERWLVLVIDFENSPATESTGPTQAELLLNDIAREYLSQLSGSNTQLHIDVSPRVTRASGTLADYGSDTNGNRDMDSNGQFLPMKLAEEAVIDQMNYADWDEYDLNDDGMVDRLLILHTSKGQEESPGQTSNIWSHFTRFDTSIEVENGIDVGHYTMASIRTGSSGMGTILHEMMHQMGAMDLYPVHEAGHLNDWQGIGDWDIMASGNWNGGGVWPALPTSASLELIGANRTQTMDLTWPSSAQVPCVGPTISMKGMSENGTSLKVPLTEYESVWIEYRSNSGFDQHLPGSGILVTYQDRSVGDEEQNELNRDPDQPWLTVIEADGRTDLRNGVNSGEVSDVFQNGSSFGAEGVLIYDHDGFLVPWVATVEINITVEIRFT
ncbi:MAG: M6 family metalloprotease domain-containing protein, partial [Candidatus Poseidoniaceae archaeon]|nr:M6 family metalloprotease domain-containing protein [Candidatus Poseidoniaceae archaeon]